MSRSCRSIGHGALALLPWLLFVFPVDVGAILSDGFVENHGQIDEAARYYASPSGVTAYFTAGGVVLDVRETLSSELPSRNVEQPLPEPVPRRGCAVRIRFEGATPDPVIEGRERLPATASFFLGNDPQGWRTDVPAFRELVYRNVWPGIDLVYRIEDTRLTYEAVVRPGADPSRIAFRYEGADRVIEAAPGSYRIETPFGNLADVRPTPGAGAISLSREGSPPAAEGCETMSWCTYLGTSSHDNPVGFALDSASRCVIAGFTNALDFPETAGHYQESFAGGAVDAFVAKLSADGDSLLWATYLGGSEPAAEGGGEEWAMVVAIDPLGSDDIVVEGWTNSNDFPTTAGCFDSTKAAPNTARRDLFVTRLSADGNSLVWSTYLGGGKEEGYYADVEFDAAGNVVVAGATQSGNFPTTPGAYMESHPNPFGNLSCAFVTKLASTGSSLEWSTFLGAAQSDFVYEIALDQPSGQVAVTGYTQSENFPTTSGAYDETYNGNYCVYVSKLSADGASLLASTFFGGPGGCTASGLVFDPLGNVVVAGDAEYTESFPTTAGAFDETHNGGLDVFVAKFDETLSDLQWCTLLGGTGDETWPQLVLDDLNCPLLGYNTASSDLPIVEGCDPTHNGGDDMAFARLTPSGHELVWSTYVGGTATDHVNLDAIELDPDGFSIVVGTVTGSDDFPTMTGAYDETHNGAGDAILFRVTPPEGPTASPEPAAWTGNSLLRSAAPNPFRHATSIRYDLPHASPVRLSVYDAAGRLVRVLEREHRSAGNHRVTWDGRDGSGSLVAAGVYFCRLEAGGSRESGTVTLLR